MNRYLLAGEADKIQDFVFRASHLREVTGGSNLLIRLCEELPKLFSLNEDSVVTSAGGSFRLIFNSSAEAEQTGGALADVYYQATGCTLSLSHPIKFDDPTGFNEANEQASAALRAAKQAQGMKAISHIPYMAYCNSTGVEIATDFQKLREDAAPSYVSNSSLNKKHERIHGKEEFLDDFYERITGEDYLLSPPSDAGELGRGGGYDGRDYVGYLVADGNNMGKIFSAVQERTKVKELSNALDNIVRDSLALATKDLWTHHPHRCSGTAPALPLILGGDDVFLLLPAPYAVDVTLRFCHYYEEKMNHYLQSKLDSPQTDNGDPLIATMAAAVVICKSKYPFQLAHQRGEELLKMAKRTGKAQTQICSTINLEIIMGNRLIDPIRTGKRQPTLRPYAIESTIAPPNDKLCTIETLQSARQTVKDLPQKRRAEVRLLFDEAKQESFEEDKWAAKIDAVVKRIGRVHDSSSNMASTLATSLHELGNSEEKAYWRDMFGTGSDFRGNALPDVLDLWNYLTVLPDMQPEVTVETEVPA